MGGARRLKRRDQFRVDGDALPGAHLGRGPGDIRHRLGGLARLPRLHNGKLAVSGAFDLLGGSSIHGCCIAHFIE